MDLWYKVVTPRKAQWISIASQESFKKARTEPLSPLDRHHFSIRGCGGQLGESRLGAAIDADIAGALSHAKALDADTKGPLRDIHRRVGCAILFESSGGRIEKVAHLPELRFALGEPEVPLPSTTRPSPWSTSPTSSARWVPMGSRSATKRR